MNLRLLSCLSVLFVLAMTSCQKAYERPDIILPTSPSTGGGTGGGGSNGAQLKKMVITTQASASTYEYSYDGNGRIAVLASTSVVQGYTITNTGSFTRDNNGNPVSYTLKSNIPDFPPEGIKWTLHYPTGAAYPDYTTSPTYVFAGSTQRDSMAVQFVNGNITQYTLYQSYSGSQMAAVTRNIYTYHANGNLASMEEYESPGNTALSKTQRTDYPSYDDKLPAFQVSAVDAIFMGSSNAVKNNVAKLVATYYQISPPVQLTNLYTYQYNAANRPVSAILKDENGAQVGSIAYTYY